MEEAYTIPPSVAAVKNLRLLGALLQTQLSIGSSDPGLTCRNRPSSACHALATDPAN